MINRFLSRLSEFAGSAILAGAGMLLGGAPAFASDNDADITTSVSALQTSVTQSTTNVATYAAFQVSATHYAARDETLSTVKVVLTTVANGTSAAPITGASATGPAGTNTTCSGLGSATVTCTTDFLKLKSQVISIAVTVAAPTDGTLVTLNASTSWLESHDGHTELETEPTRTASVGLDAPDPNKLNSFVPASTAATTLFPSSAACVTGPYVGCAATSLQTWTTTVEIPPSSQATTAQILQAIVPGGCASNLLTCSSSTLTIPGSFSHLVITLRRDASTIARKAKIASAIIYYDGTPKLPPAGVIYPLQVPNCTDTTYGVLPLPGIPCIKVRTAYPKKSGDDDDNKSSSNLLPVPPEFPGDWEFVIWALDNGKYSN